AIATLACAMSENSAAAKLLGAIATFLSTSGSVLDLIDQMAYDRCALITKSELDAAAFENAWDVGRSWSLPDAAAEGLTLATRAKFALSAIPSPSLLDLTAREREVLRLVAQKMTNAQIAAKLVVSVRTVNTHLSSIYRKLNTSSRATAIRI